MRVTAKRLAGPALINTNSDTRLIINEFILNHVVYLRKCFVREHPSPRGMSQNGIVRWFKSADKDSEVLLSDFTPLTTRVSAEDADQESDPGSDGDKQIDSGE